MARYWREAVIVLIFGGLMWMVWQMAGLENQVVDLTRQNQSLAKQNQRVNQQLAEYRAGLNIPREFETVDDFKDWAAGHKSTLGTSFEQVVRLQADALRDGYLVDYQYVTNAATGAHEFWPSAKIGAEIYTIEPVTDMVTQFYPRNWWR